MTDKIRGSIGPDGPPWSVDLLADLHAGVVDPRTGAELGPRVESDPQARAVLAALDSVQADLAGLREAPAPPMPDHLAARLDAALAAEAQRAFGVAAAPRTPRPAASGPVVDLAAARRKRGRVASWGVGLLAAAAAAVAIGVAVLPGNSNTTGGVAAPENSAPQSAPADATPPLAITRDDVGAVVGQVNGSRDYGPLKDEAGLNRCLLAHSVDAAKTQVAGVRPVTLDGKSGVMILMLTPEPGRLRVLVVQPDCSALFDQAIGR